MTSVFVFGEHARQNLILHLGDVLNACALNEALRDPWGHDRGDARNVRGGVFCYCCAIELLVDVLYIIVTRV